MYLQGLEEMGLLGIFILSLIANSIPFVGLPYLLVVAVYAANCGNPIIVGIISGVGAAVGKIIIYLIPSLTRRFVSKETKARLDAFRELVQKYLFLAIVLFAASPLPDDLLYIPVGFMGYDIVKYFIACTIGKVILTVGLCIFSKSYLYLMTEYMGVNSLWSTIILVVLCLIATYLLAKIDWVEVAKTAKKEGFIEAGKLLLKKYFFKPCRKKTS
ncbi:MAG: hypothetical protein DRN04_04340 [Thermoprotei archaeon]|nr:MAG: hypothetical protein DRN04_04340 [Thermoprotei archaeon]